jgi:transposase
MSAKSFVSETSPVVGEADSVPFASEFVTLSKQEHIQLLMNAHYFKSMHQRALERADWREARLLRLLRQLKEQNAQREDALRAELAAAQAKIRDLQQRLFGRKSERHQGNERQGRDAGAHAARGHPRGVPSHGRTMQSNLPAHHEFIELETPQCPNCGLSLKPFAGTEDSQVLEIEVNAYRRVIHRKRYVPTCHCGCLPGIVTAPTPAKLIAKGKFGISVWTHVLLDKFLYARPSQRLVQELGARGLPMSAGTLAGGLQTIAPLFQPIEQALWSRLRSEPHWHADETRWAVFLELQGKVGHRWYLWVFHSRSVVHYVLDQSRSTQVLQDELTGIEQGIISCDRFSAYKKFARLHPGVVLAYCWAHQRRDFLELANAHPDLSPWAFEWVHAIGELYRLNDLRLQAPPGSTERANVQADLQQAMQRMAHRRESALADTQLAAPALKVLQSMAAHWCGLSVFVDYPWVPMDNNIAERDMRAPVVGRKNFYGSGAQWSGELAAAMYSVLATLKLWGINAHAWLSAYLQACAENAQRAPADLSGFLPWAMDETRLAAMRAVAPGVSALVEELDSS